MKLTDVLLFPFWLLGAALAVVLCIACAIAIVPIGLMNRGFCAVLERFQDWQDGFLDWAMSHEARKEGNE